MKFYVYLETLRNAIQVIHLLCINVKRENRVQPSDKCKERNNSVLHLMETKFVTSGESPGITPYIFAKRLYLLKVHTYFLPSNLLLNDKTPTMFSIFSRKKKFVKSHLLVLFSFSVLFARSHEDD